MLITNLTEAKKYIPSTAIQRFDVIESFIENAEIKEIKPILGDDLYGEMIEYYEGSADGEVKHQDLLPYIQRPLIHFAYYEAVHILDVTPTSHGFAVVSNNQQAPASSNRVEAFKKSMLKAAYDGIESLLQYLESNKSDYSNWTESSAYSEKTGHLITSARDFDKFVKINQSRYVFLTMLPQLEYFEEFEIKPAISEELFDKLLFEAKAAEMGTEYEKIYKLLRHAIANLTFAKSLDYLATAVYAEGIMLHYSAGSSERIETLRKDLLTTGNGYLNKARGVILANPDDYPEFKASDLYDEEITQVKPDYENDEDSHIAAFG